MTTSTATAVRERVHRIRRVPWVLVIALLVSLIFHIALSLWPVQLQGEDTPPPLSVSITELPPPPAPVTAEAPKPKAAKPRPKRQAAPPPTAVAQVEPAPAPTPEQSDVSQDAPPVADASPALDEAVPVAAAPATPPPRALPPRIDLVYRAFLGTQGFLIGDAVYRLEHTANQYSISTVAEARGLVALFYRGQAKARSEGAITASGLQPNTYSIERANSTRREAANFDWESGMIQLGDSAVPLELPTFDPLVVLWQFYFAPPEQDVVNFNIATTRKIYHYTFHRTGNEKVTLPFGEVDTDVWTQDGGDGSISAKIWLAPSLHFVAVKVQLSNAHATIETLLDSMRVDDTVAQQ